MKKGITEETRIKKEIKDYLKLYGWFVYHNLAGLGVYTGLSDLTAILGGLVVFIEVKTKKGKQSDNQIKFQKSIESHGGNYIVARGYEDIQEFINGNRKGLQNTNDQGFCNA